MKRRRRSYRYTLCPRCQGYLTISVLGEEGAKEVVECTLCKGTGKYRDRPLSPHFRLKEFLKSQTAARKVIDNSPTPEIIDNLKRLSRTLLEPIRRRFGPLMITSGYRSYELNAAIGGSPTSAHPKGAAADFVPYRRVSLKTVVDWVIDQKLPYDQIIFEGSWIHIGLFREHPEDRPRHIALMMFGGKYSEYDPDDQRVTGVDS